MSAVVGKDGEKKKTKGGRKFNLQHEIAKVLMEKGCPQEKAVAIAYQAVLKHEKGNDRVLALTTAFDIFERQKKTRGRSQQLNTNKTVGLKGSRVFDLRAKLFLPEEARILKLFKRC